MVVTTLYLFLPGLKFFPALLLWEMLQWRLPRVFWLSYMTEIKLRSRTRCHCSQEIRQQHQHRSWEDKCGQMYDCPPGCFIEMTVGVLVQYLGQVSNSEPICSALIRALEATQGLPSTTTHY